MINIRKYLGKIPCYFGWHRFFFSMPITLNKYDNAYFDSYYGCYHCDIKDYKRVEEETKKLIDFLKGLSNNDSQINK